MTRRGDKSRVRRFNHAHTGEHVVKILIRLKGNDDPSARSIATFIADSTKEAVPSGATMEVTLRRHGDKSGVNLLIPNEPDPKSEVRCTVCKAKGHVTPAGWICMNGHGGTDDGGA